MRQKYKNEEETTNSGTQDGEETHRFEIPDSEDQLIKMIENIFDANLVSQDINPSEFEWEIDWIDIDEVEVNPDNHIESSDIALNEMFATKEKVQLAVGEGYPLGVIGDENTLIEGYVRYNLLKDFFEEERVPVYRGIKNK